MDDGRPFALLTGRKCETIFVPRPLVLRPSASSHPPRYPYPPKDMEMDPQEEREKERKPKDMHAVKPQKRLTGHLGSAPRERRQELPRKGHRTEHVRPYDRC